MSRRIVQPPLDQWVTTGVENTVFAAVEGLAHSPKPHPLPVMEEPVTVEDFRHVAEETVRLNPNVARRARYMGENEAPRKDTLRSHVLGNFDWSNRREPYV